GLEEESAGIMELSRNLRVGSNLGEVIDFTDEVLEFIVPFNRPDAMSMKGMAKEIAAACRLRYFEPRYKVKEDNRQKIDDLLDVQVKDIDGCGRYSARVLLDVKVGESPLWLKRRLILAGLRPINSVVDITNYVMLEYGQPLHAFDYDLIIGHKLIVRRAKNGERIITLDEQKKVLTSKDLIIADEKRPLVIAGIMGGLDSGVSSKSRRIVLESANFARKLINDSAKNLGIQTDSSIRFGKGLPLSLSTEALDRATYLIQKLCGARVARDMIDVRSKRILKRDLRLSYANINSFLGVEINKLDIKKILKSLDFEIKKASESDLLVNIPPVRIDIENEDDLIEEVGRIHGYNKIDSQSFSMPVVLPRPEKWRRYRNAIINYLASRGWSEVYSYNFVSEAGTVDWGFDLNDSFELINPVDKSLKYLRQSMLPGLVERYQRWKREDEQVKIFEWGRVFSKSIKDKEEPHLGLAYSDEARAKDLFLRAKGLVEGILALGNLGWNDFELKRVKDVDLDIDYLHPVNSLVLLKGKQVIGLWGLIHPNKASEWKIKGPMVYIDFDLAKLIDNFVATKKFVAPSKFPVSKFDIALLVDRQLMAGDLIGAASQIGGENLRRVEVFDETMGTQLQIIRPRRIRLGWTNDKLQEGSDINNLKSLGLRFSWQSNTETLGDKWVEDKMNSIVMALGEQFGAVLRDK
ncbi:MAG: phenylalanine--tRNA ligase subunit beta, partial [Patescibacteria group bacterium]